MTVLWKEMSFFFSYPCFKRTVYRNVAISKAVKSVNYNKKHLGIVMNVLINRLKKHIKSRLQWGNEASTEEIQVIIESLETVLFCPSI